MLKKTWQVGHTSKIAGIVRYTFNDLIGVLHFWHGHCDGEKTEKTKPTVGLDSWRGLKNSEAGRRVFKRVSCIKPSEKRHPYPLWGHPRGSS